MPIFKKAISLLCLFALQLSAQKIPVYHTDDLINRIEQSKGLLVVNFWATWCKPCIEELPVFDSLVSEERNVTVLLVNLDFAEKADQVQAFLLKRNIRSECVLLDEVNGNAFIDRISNDWSGAIPATLMHEGSKKKLLEQKFRLHTLKMAVADFRGQK